MNKTTAVPLCQSGIVSTLHSSLCLIILHCKNYSDIKTKVTKTIVSKNLRNLSSLEALIQNNFDAWILDTAPV